MGTDFGVIDLTDDVRIDLGIIELTDDEWGSRVGLHVWVDNETARNAAEAPNM